MYAFSGVRKRELAHTSSLQATVIDWLRQNRGLHEMADMEEKLGFPIREHPQLLQSLQNNPKIVIQGTLMRYKPVYEQISGRKELIAFLEQNRDGLSMAAVKDAYIGIEKDIESLIQREQVYKIDNTETKSFNVYWRDRAYDMQIEYRVQDLWRSIRVPNEVQVKQVLLEHDLVTKQEVESGYQDQKRTRRRGKKRGQGGRGTGTRKRAKYVPTNTHMLDQFDWLRQSSKSARK